MGERIHVGICLDEHLIDAAIVLLSSIKENARRERPVLVYVLTTFDPDMLTPRCEVLRTEEFSFEVINVGNAFSTLPRSDYITQGTYLRFLFPELVEPRKLIYLDIDTVVNRPLDALYDVEVGRDGLAAAFDAAMKVGSPRWNNYSIDHDGTKFSFDEYLDKALGLCSRRRKIYFNAGVLVMDLPIWRREGIAKKTLAALAERKPAFLDQDALNMVFDGRYIELDTRWNAFASCSHPPDLRLGTLLSRGGRAWEKARAIWRSDPWIVHFAGPAKPWERKLPATPLDHVWWSYAHRSPAWGALEGTYRAKQ